MGVEKILAHSGPGQQTGDADTEVDDELSVRGQGLVALLIVVGVDLREMRHADKIESMKVQLQDVDLELPACPG